MGRRDFHFYITLMIPSDFCYMICIVKFSLVPSTLKPESSTGPGKSVFSNIICLFMSFIRGIRRNMRKFYKLVVINTTFTCNRIQREFIEDNFALKCVSGTDGTQYRYIIYKITLSFYGHL